jgi:hypothetical protein
MKRARIQIVRASLVSIGGRAVREIPNRLGVGEEPLCPQRGKGRK